MRRAPREVDAVTILMQIIKRIPWRNAPLLELIAPQRQLVMVRAERVRVVRRGAVRLLLRDLSQTADEIEDDSSYP